MITIIPMAGKGERFVKEGYSTPKPLILVNNLPMVVKAVKDLPSGDKQIFIILDEHIKRHGIDKEIKNFLPKSEFVVIDGVTEGQACTALLGLAGVNDNEEIIIGACDNGMIINQNLFESLRLKADVMVFTFRYNVTVKDKPSQYGWVATDGEARVTRVSVKKPISDKPINDHAVVGAFWFKSAKIYKEAAYKMIRENRRINNEFYIDECINDAIDLGYKVYAFETDKYICWGTPGDYNTWQYWESFFSSKVK